MAPTDRVSDVLARDEALVEVFVRHAPHFEKLRHAAVRRVMARLVTVEEAARMADVSIDSLLRDLNEALHIESSQTARTTPETSSMPATQSSGHRPESLHEVELDLREEMRSGREPFSRIMAAVAALESHDMLLLRTIFEPVPLFGLMAKRGFHHEATRYAPDDWSIWFWRGEREALVRDPIATDAEPDSAAGADVPSSEAGTKSSEPPTVWLDVRGLQPPEPLTRTLAALETLPEGHQLVQINARVPQILLPMLSERGFACEIDSSDVDRVRVRIWRAAPR